MKITEQTPFPATYENPYDPITNEDGYPDEQTPADDNWCDVCGEAKPDDTFVVTGENGETHLCFDHWVKWMVWNYLPEKVITEVMCEASANREEAIEIINDLIPDPVIRTAFRVHPLIGAILINNLGG